MASVTAVAAPTFVGDKDEQLVTMIVDNQLFGIPILQVQDIVEASRITPVPLAPSAIAGVLNLRGRIVTVIDLRKLLGNHDEVAWDSQMGVTVEYKGDLYTLLVDAIGDVRSLSRRDYDKAPSTMEAAIKKLCSGIYRLRGNLLVVLDVGRILHADVIAGTPMLSVTDRKRRKEEARKNARGDEGHAKQLSALMTDLNSYEADVEAGRNGRYDTTSDDIKARKKANRNRRPVSDRWQEVLEERSRRDGKVTYRMREPDEETLEDARSETENDDAEWQNRVRLPGEDMLDDERHDEPVSAAPAFVEPEAVASSDDMTAEFDPLAEEAAPVEETSQGGAVSGWWNRLRGKGEENADADVSDAAPESEPAVEDKASDNSGKTGKSGGKSKGGSKSKKK